MCYERTGGSEGLHDRQFNLKPKHNGGTVHAECNRKTQIETIRMYRIVVRIVVPIFGGLFQTSLGNVNLGTSWDYIQFPVHIGLLYSQKAPKGHHCQPLQSDI